MKTLLILIIAIILIVVIGNAVRTNYSVFVQPETTEPEPEEQTETELIEFDPHAEPTLPSHPSDDLQIVKARDFLPYICILPREYGREAKKYPTVVVLHGNGAQGDDLAPQLSSAQSFCDFLRSHHPTTFIAMLPQCPAGSNWKVPLLKAFFQGASARFMVDSDQVYLMGISMGGQGTWEFACDYPNYFAAIAVICGGGNPILARQNLTDMPIWIFHGQLDTVVPFRRGIEMAGALKAAGNKNLKYTFFSDKGHDLGSEMYNIELYQWFLQFKKSDRNKPVTVSKEDKKQSTR